MYPRTKAGASLYREKKRNIEIARIMDHITNFLHANRGIGTTPLQILEFGSGPGYQTPYLRDLGNLIASDIFVSDGIRKFQPEILFFQFSILDAPIRDDYFDVVYSNHVIEHIENIGSAFQEMQRIGKPDCIYAFSVPTNIWLLLSLPAQFYNQMRRFMGIDPSKNKSGENREKSDKPAVNRNLERYYPRGHGAKKEYWDCYQAFKLGSWRRLSEDNGFTIKGFHPLLLYAASEWPIVPLTDILNKLNICSSVLFILQTNNPSKIIENSAVQWNLVG